MTGNPLRSLNASRKSGRPIGITSVCSAHPTVIRAALLRTKQKSQPVLIEATCNQVNQFGGYTGMTPERFVAFVKAIAIEEGVSDGQIIFGGDHLGPNPWRNEPAADALQKASDLVAAYVAAGFTKIHIDASMGCAGEAIALDDETVAERAAKLCQRAEDEAKTSGYGSPFYVLGTEVPIPGGVNHSINTVEPTSRTAAQATIDIHRDAFHRAGLGDAFARVLAFIVQPGVEFGSENVLAFAPDKAKDLSSLLSQEDGLLFEAHSTDYQSQEALTALVQSGFAILKVGPELTFAYREALYCLDLMACELSQDYAASSLREKLEKIMLDKRHHWQSYYHGSDSELRLQRHYSYSDRIRYYWNEPKAQAAVGSLIDMLNQTDIPETVLRQYLPGLPLKAEFEPHAFLIAAVDRVLERYDRAAGVVSEAQ